MYRRICQLCRSKVFNRESIGFGVSCASSSPRCIFLDLPFRTSRRILRVVYLSLPAAFLRRDARTPSLLAAACESRVLLVSSPSFHGLQLSINPIFAKTFLLPLLPTRLASSIDFQDLILAFHVYTAHFLFDRSFFLGRSVSVLRFDASSSLSVFPCFFFPRLEATSTDPTPFEARATHRLRRARAPGLDAHRGVEHRPN